MRCTITRAARAIALAALCAAAGCSVVESFRDARDAREAVTRGDAALEDAAYNDALTQYAHARRLLQEAKDFGYPADGDLRKVDEAIGRTIEEAESEGYVRVGDRYPEENELGRALAAELEKMLESSRMLPLPGERMVPGSIAVSARKGADGTYDIDLETVLKDAEKHGDFAQDAWATARFFLEGGFGYGFMYHVACPFENRPWMGTEAAWGASSARGSVNHIIGLKGRIARLSISVYRGRYRKMLPETRDRYGFVALEAVGPYWKKSRFITYTMTAADAARLNWAEAKEIPDETLYRLLSIDRGGPGAPSEGAAATASVRTR